MFKSSQVRNNLRQFDLILVKTATNQTSFLFRRNRKKTTWRTQLTGTVDLRPCKLTV